MKKRFGQNLLVDNIYINKILNSLEISPTETVLEIGSGSGLLTEPLSKRVKKLYAVEFERDIIKFLKSKVQSENLNNVEIINDDILRVDINSLVSDSITVVGNIPYNITSKIIIKLLGEIGSPSETVLKTKSIYLMVQKEVAERLSAKPNTKAYSPLTLLLNYFADARILFNVPASAFSPPPKVTSAFIEIIPRKTLPEVKNPLLLKEIVRTIFQQKRKKLINPLSLILKDKKLASEILQKVEIDGNLRPENLSLADYIKLADEITKY